MLVKPLLRDLRTEKHCFACFMVHVRMINIYLSVLIFLIPLLGIDFIGTYNNDNDNAVITVSFGYWTDKQHRWLLER